MKPVQEYKQRFLDCAQEDSEKVMHPTEDCYLLKYGKVIAESWEQMIADDQAVREEMKREEAEHIAQQKEEEAKKEAEQKEAQLKPMAEAREKLCTQRREAGKPPLLPKIPEDKWAKLITQWLCRPRR